MILITAHTPAQRLGMLLSALIIVSSLIGMTLDKHVYAGVPRPDFFCYFTNLSNLAVLIYFALLAPFFYAYDFLARFIPSLEFAVTMCMMLTHIVFHMLILPHVRRYTRQDTTVEALKIKAVNTLFVHYIVPWLVLAYWLLCAPGKQTLTLCTGLLWLIVPVCYAVGIFIRARRCGVIPGLETPYPYPFLDLTMRSRAAVARSCTGLFLLCAGASILLILLLQACFAIFGSGRLFFLV